MTEPDYCLISFASTHAALRARQALTGVCPAVVMPVLREISLGCGMALRLHPAHLSAARTARGESGLPRETYAFYRVTGSGSALRAEPLE